MDTTIDDAVAAETARLRALYSGAGTRAIMEQLTLESVLAEVLERVRGVAFSQSDLEQIRTVFGLPSRDPPLPDNVVKFKPRARDAAPTHGGSAA